VGGETSDDAGVYRLNPDQAVVLTVDVLTPVVDDPYTFGQVAAANSLSDVYAMGGKPLAALCVLGYPVGEIEHETIRTILTGVWDKVREAGAVIAGGHTMKDMELRCGLSVTGAVHPNRVITNAAARPGDAVILTKPLGIGIITTALRANLVSAETIAQASRVMSELNDSAAETMLACGAQSATDITGFGLLGHAWEMAQASRVDIVIEAHSVPIIPEAFELARQSLFPVGSVKNYQFMKSRADFARSVPDELQMLLCDAQTSGGLFIAIPAELASELVERLHSNGVIQAAQVGHVTPGTGRVRVE
jgi:selenide,water dikinase